MYKQAFNTTHSQCQDSIRDDVEASSQCAAFRACNAALADKSMIKADGDLISLASSEQVCDYALSYLPREIDNW